MTPIADALRNCIAGNGGRLTLVAVDGPAGAGKSTLAAQLASQIAGSAVAHVDDFAHGWNWGWDWTRFRAQVLDPLLAGHRARYQRFDWDAQALAEWHELAPELAVLITEGVSVTRTELGVAWDVTVWVEACSDLRLRRGLERDGEAARPLWKRWMTAEEEWISVEHPEDRCDFRYWGADV